ncbi:hypothetical protein TRFO_19723 [Tritrichomonas foetus]|uniref:Phosphoprotein phosphatase n=1 Tax=Tritrichomonas foetus TaxID=1144522 RepID=A0A1J4KN70_9EUKA|nr:hypothetical protein TRFO_19723 [Tritrichomonas foetus]|eukprot:OHT10837.1 hypothetical protein TRFO_19723 [Tritrichomonas foetus]
MLCVKPKIIQPIKKSTPSLLSQTTTALISARQPIGRRSSFGAPNLRYSTQPIKSTSPTHNRADDFAIAAIKACKIPEDEYVACDDPNMLSSYLNIPPPVEIDRLIGITANFKQLSEQVQEKLIQFVTDFVFKPQKPVNPSFYYYDISTEIANKASRSICQIYQMIKMIAYHKPDFPIQDKFIRRLVRLLDTPDTHQQEKLVDLLIYFRNNYDIDECLFESLIDMFSFHSDGTIPYFCIKSVIRLLIVICNQKSEFVNHKLLLKALPLFISDHLVSFFDDFSELLVLFAQDESFYLEEIKYLLKHWPRTNSGKQFCFVLRLCSLSCSANLSQFQSRVATHVEEAMWSDNLATSLSTLAFLGDEEVMTAIMAADKYLAERIAITMKQLNKSWSSRITDAARETLDKYFAKGIINQDTENNNVNEEEEAKESEVTSQMTWDIMRTLAAENEKLLAF